MTVDRALFENRSCRAGVDTDPAVSAAVLHRPVRLQGQIGYYNSQKMKTAFVDIPIYAEFRSYNQAVFPDKSDPGMGSE